MSKNYIEDKTFTDVDHSVESLPQGEYDHCIFNNCNFSGSNLSGTTFIACEFHVCNISSAALTKTSFQGIKFVGCKMLGLHFNDCSHLIFDAQFDDCTLNFSSFYKMKLKKTIFNNCIMQEVDLAEADLTASLFNNCDLMSAVFDRTILEKADLQTAYNYSIDPEKNSIKKAKFSIMGIKGLLDKYDLVVQ